MGIYVFVGGKVIEFRDSLDFDFQLIGENTALVEVKGQGELIESVVVGEGDAVLLDAVLRGSPRPVLRSKPEASPHGLCVGAVGRWFVFPSARFERPPKDLPKAPTNILKVFSRVKDDFRDDERAVGLFWLRAGDSFGKGAGMQAESGGPET